MSKTLHLSAASDSEGGSGGGSGSQNADTWNNSLCPHFTLWSLVATKALGGKRLQHSVWCVGTVTVCVCLKIVC